MWPISDTSDFATTDGDGNGVPDGGEPLLDADGNQVVVDVVKDGVIVPFGTGTDEDPLRYFHKRSQTISERPEAVFDGSSSNTQVYGEVRYDEAGQVWRYVEDTEEIILITDEDAAHYGISGQGSLPEGSGGNPLYEDIAYSLQISHDGNGRYWGYEPNTNTFSQGRVSGLPVYEVTQVVFWIVGNMTRS